MKLKKTITLLITVFIFQTVALSQVSISKDDRTAHPAALLDLVANEKGFLMPRLTMEERNEITNLDEIHEGVDAEFLMIINTDSKCIEMYVENSWNPIWCHDHCDGIKEVTFIYNEEEVTYGTVSNAGQCWLDRVLGACPDTNPEDYTDANDFRGKGDLFQWGRLDDGHQLIDREENEVISNTTTAKSGSDIPGHNLFINAGSGEDWLVTRNDNLWDDANGASNPCPNGWRPPTKDEMEIEMNSWHGVGRDVAFASPLRFTTGGRRESTTAVELNRTSTQGNYWTSTNSTDEPGESVFLMITSTANYFSEFNRARGASVRCIKD